MYEDRNVPSTIGIGSLMSQCQINQRPKYLKIEMTWDRYILGTNRPWTEMLRVRNVQGTNFLYPKLSWNEIVKAQIIWDVIAEHQYVPKSVLPRTIIIVHQITCDTDTPVLKIPRRKVSFGRNIKVPK